MVLRRPLDTAAMYRAAFTLRVVDHCPNCGTVRESFDCIALGNTIMSDALTLATLCVDCGQWAIVAGDCRLRLPRGGECDEILRDHRTSLMWAEWRLSAVTAA